jgi:hypothetical protein
MRTKSLLYHRQEALMAQRIAAVTFALFALVTSAAHAATLTVTDGSFTYWPTTPDPTAVGDPFVVPTTSVFEVF